MRDETIARNYAEALFELARREDAVEEYLGHVRDLGRLFAGDPRFEQFLGTPRVDESEKKRVVSETFYGTFPRPFVNFLLVTIEKRRQRILPEIVREFEKLNDEKLNRVRVDLTLARPLGDEAIEDITDRLSKLLGKCAVPTVRVRPEILGGIIARTGDVVYDGSIRRRLERMRRKLLAAPLPGGVMDISDVQAAKALS